MNTTDTPTPRTDAAIVELIHAFSHNRVAYVPADFARTLERELEQWKLSALRGRQIAVDGFELDQARERAQRHRLEALKHEASNAALRAALEFLLIGYEGLGGDLENNCAVQARAALAKEAAT
jgi:hypothetical protein